MIKQIFIIYLFLLFTQTSRAQFDTAAVKLNILNQSDSMFTAFKNKDWNSFSNYMHPAIFKLVKGKKEFIQLLETQMKELQNLTFTDYKQVGNVQIIAANKTLQCMVIYGLQMLIDSSVISGVSSSIGESTDNGATWKFIRNNSNTLNQVYTQFPWISTSLKIAKEDQVFGVSLPQYLATYQPVYLKNLPKTFGVRSKTSTRKKIN